MNSYQLLSDLEERNSQIANRLKQLDEYNRNLTQRHQELKEKLKCNAAGREALLGQLKKSLRTKEDF